MAVKFFSAHELHELARVASQAYTMSSCKRKQFKPQKIFEKFHLEQKYFEKADRSNDMSQNTNETIHGIQRDHFNELVAEKLKDYLEHSSTQIKTEMIHIIENLLLSNIIPLLSSNLKNEPEFASSQSMIESKPDIVNPTDLIKESMEKFFSTNSSNVDYLRKPSSGNLKNIDPSYLCSQNVETLPVHVRQPKHKKHLEKEDIKRKIPEIENFPAFNSFLPPKDIPLKMVRGQEEWVNNSRHNKFISQILKCLECSASFETLADLSVHMLNSNHFLKFQGMNRPSSMAIFNESTLRHSKREEPIHEDRLNFSQQFLKKTLPVKPKKREHFNTCKLKNSIPSKTLCQICNKTFDKFSKSSQLPPLVKLIQHLQNAHKINHICTNCGSYFKTKEQLQTHLVEENYSHHYILNNHSKKSDQIYKKESLKVIVNSEQMNDNKLSSMMNKSNSTRSMSPAVSPISTSSTSYSTNSSPSSFLFDSPNITLKEKPQIFNSITDNSFISSNTGNHLQALQMLVDGNSPQQSSQIKIKSPVLTKEPAQKSPQSIKLPAKKRPYVEELDDAVQYSKNVKRLRTEEHTNLSKDNKCHPLNSLQQMHLNLDEYLMR